MKRESKARTGDGGLGHDELRDRWLELYPNIAFGGGEWRRYEAGHWQPVEDLAVEAQVMDVLERSREEGVKVTSHLLNSVRKLGQLSVYVPRERWDANPDILVFSNGTLEISERRFREHKPEDYATSALPYAYDPEAACEVFRAVLGNVAPDAVEFLQEFAGYCLTPDTSLETALWFKGPRGSGKSTVIEGLVAMLGDKHGVLGLGEIESSPFALSRIPGKTLLVSTEQPSFVPPLDARHRRPNLGRVDHHGPQAPRRRGGYANRKDRLGDERGTADCEHHVRHLSARQDRGVPGPRGRARPRR